MALLKIMYGPYEAYGIIKHRMQKIRGLFDALTILGYEMELVETNLLNRLTIELCRRNIFSCDIRNVMFNMDQEDDVVCQRAISAVNEAWERFNIDENIPEYSPVFKGKRQMEEDRMNASDIISDLMYEFPSRTDK